jgi:hypothetical protein
MRGSRVCHEPARPFRTASIDHIQCGHLDCGADERDHGAALGLYSITFNNRLECDLEALQRFKEFREEAERKRFRYFLEVFNPNQPEAVTDEERPDFINDVIARTLAGVTSAGRPLFLKIAYQGPQAMEQLTRYDPHLIVGILGGSSGTTLDAFQLIHEAQKHGARVALFGRKINQAEHQLAFIQFLRHIVEGLVSPQEAVRAYHGVLQELDISPHRSLDEDLTLQTPELAYAAGTTGSSSASQPHKTVVTPPVTGHTADPVVDFKSMTSEQRLAYHLDRMNRVLG